MAEVDTRCAEKKKPEEKPVQQPWEEALDWDAYYKNRGLISTRLGVKKSEYLQCSTKPDKKDPKKAPPSCCSSCPVQDRATVYIADCPTPKRRASPIRNTCAASPPIWWSKGWTCPAGSSSAQRS